MFFINGPLALLNAIKFFAAFGLWLFVAREAWGALRRGGVAEGATEGGV
jgi:hypothetical protein